MQEFDKRGKVAVSLPIIFSISCIFLLAHNIQIASNLLIFNVSLNTLFYIVPKSFPMVSIWEVWVHYHSFCFMYAVPRPAPTFLIYPWARS